MPVHRAFEKTLSRLGCLTLAGFIALPAAGGEGVSFDGSASVGFDNQYNFRGFKAGDWAPSIAADFIVPACANSELAFNLGGWYVDPIDDVYNELGLYAFLLVPVADFQFRLGGIFFALPDEDWVTGEFGAAISHPVWDLFDVVVSWWTDVKGDGSSEVKADGSAKHELGLGHYAELRVERSFELNDWLRVDLVAGASYGIDYYGSDGWNNAFATAGLPIGLSEKITLTPYVGGTLALEGLRDAGEHDQFLAGIRLTVGF